MMTENMKGLIIAHSPMNFTSGNGKTIAAMFQKWADSDLAQIYITSQQPDFSICKNFYKITDSEIVKSLLHRSIEAGHEVKEQAGAVKSLPVKKRKLHFSCNSTGGRLLRNFFWNRKKWKNDKLVKWVEEQSPDFVFLAAGNLEATFDLAEFIAMRRQIPLIVHIGDDYYTKSEETSFLKEWQRKRLSAKLQAAIDSSRLVIAISDKMVDKFKAVYGGNYVTCMNCVDLSETYHAAAFFEKDKSQYNMVYIGNLSVNRWKVLPVISKALDCIGDIRIELNIYSSIKDEKILKLIEKLPHIHYCGTVYGEELHKVRENADIMLILESFDPSVKRILETAMSTKVPEYLHTERPILAVGPGYSGTIEFLHKNGLSEIVCEENSEEIQNVLSQMIKEKESVYEKVQKGKNVVKEKFSLEANSEMIYKYVSEICTKG